MAALLMPAAHGVAPAPVLAAVQRPRKLAARLPPFDHLASPAWALCPRLRKPGWEAGEPKGTDREAGHVLVQ